MILPLNTEKCPDCGASFRNNGHRRGRQNVYCTGPVTHYHSISRNEITKEMTNEGISIDTFRKKYDNRYKLREAAKGLTEGTLVPEAELIRKNKIIGGYKTIVEEEAFKPFRGKVNSSTVFWSHPKTIEKLKGEGLLL